MMSSTPAPFAAPIRPCLSGLLVIAMVVITAGAIQACPTPPRQEPKPKANRLADETSPYLLLHARNPVDWYPWGSEAFARAKEEGKPIFLSVGYSSCYWCHVMERESFHDEKIAEYLNEHFICIKVDREERPDVDQLYMTALQAFAGRGGWPLSMFLTPDGKPFFGGTYFPPEPRNGLPGFLQIAEAVQKAWTDQREAVEKDAELLTNAVRRASGGPVVLERIPLDRRLVTLGIEQLAESFDPEFGGFGFDPDNPRRPKFPEPVNLIYLLEQHRRGRGDQSPQPPLNMVEKTFDHMARGGIRDQLAGGYHRYSTDRYWLVPHFEKMLYDNALLAQAFVQDYEITGNEQSREEAEATLQWVLHAMTDPQGGFYSAMDAESEQEEGKSYVWTREEVAAVLSDPGAFDRFATCHGLKLDPNFEGNRYVLHLPKNLQAHAEDLGLSIEELKQSLAESRAILLETRNKRPAPLLDDKILTAWNGLMIGAFADAARVLESKPYQDAAERAADFVLKNLRDVNGRLFRTYRQGQARLPAYLEDYAYLVDGLLRLHKTTDNDRWINAARELTDQMINDFADERGGGFYFTAHDHESLLARVKDPIDNALPSANAVSVRSLVRLSNLTDENAYLQAAERTLQAFAPILERAPASTPTMLLALDEYLDASRPEAMADLFRPGRAPAPAPGSVVDSSDRLTVRIELPADADLKSPDPVDLLVTLEIQEGWHVNANPVGVPELVPTSIRLPSDSPLELVEVRYPPGKPLILPGQQEPIQVYDGTVKIPVTIRWKNRAGRDLASAIFQVRVQACDDRMCLAPATIHRALTRRDQQP